MPALKFIAGAPQEYNKTVSLRAALMTRMRLRTLMSASPFMLVLALAPAASAHAGGTAPTMATRAASNPFACSLPKLPVSGAGSVITDASPGKKDFAYGATAMHRKDYRHAVYMFKLAAFYADAPAEYDLGLMYFRGNGVPVDKPLGAAWMVLAAQQGNPFYVRARNLLVTDMSEAEFHRMRGIWAKLSWKYGERVALPRAEHVWQRVLSTSDPCGRVGTWACAGAAVASVGPFGGIQMVAGSAAAEGFSLRGIWRIRNPYDYHGDRETYPAGTTPCPSGSVKVEPLQQVSMGGGSAKGSAKPADRNVSPDTR